MLTYTDIEDMRQHKDYAGFGYIGHESRCHASDVWLAKAANKAKLTAEQTFMWANSKFGRRFMDQYTVGDFRRWTSCNLLSEVMRKHVKELERELAPPAMHYGDTDAGYRG
jgi:hypothetical protein